MKWLRQKAASNIRYGNYCGPGPYLNPQSCQNLDTGETPPAPINQTDALCKQHDIDYCKCGVTSTAGIPGFGTGCSSEADEKLIRDIARKLKNNEIKDPKERWAAQLIKYYFMTQGFVNYLKNSP